MAIGWLVTTLVFLLAAYFMPGVHITSLWAALLAAVVLSIVNLFVKPILFILTLPINLMTLGLFTFVINALMIWLVSFIVAGFIIDGFSWALALALILAVVKSILH